jgi:catechol 2,3-dioxygenase-like lactoylglutathione lyase family enzyme
MLLFGIALAIAPYTPAHSQATPPTSPTDPVLTAQTDRSVRAVTRVGMTVSDLDEAVEFYSQVLNFEIISDVEVFGSEYERLQGVFGARVRIVQMRLGDEVIELSEYLTPRGKPIPVDSRSNDLWFQHAAVVVSDMEAAYQRLRRFNVRHVSTAPQTLPESIPAAAGIEAFYFQDPDGHNLEIIAYPPDKGDPRWQADEPLFLGIDHTAIAISNTSASLDFYEDLLGLDVMGESENFGIEQSRLNQVFGARLRITGLQAIEGIGVEFLEYLSPSDGRPYPPDVRPNDLIHWDITMEVTDANWMYQKLKRDGVEFISAGVIMLPDSSLGFHRGFLVRDPDGHAIRIVER